MAQLALGLNHKILDRKLTLNASLVADLTSNASQLKKRETATAETKLTSLNSDLDQLDLEQDALLTAEARSIESTAPGGRDTGRGVWGQHLSRVLQHAGQRLVVGRPCGHAVQACSHRIDQRPGLFQVSALGATGQGPGSDLARKRAG